jgi:hypothetical protein
LNNDLKQETNVDKRQELSDKKQAAHDETRRHLEKYKTMKRRM